MDSTMLYQLVLEQLHTGKELVNLLPPLHSLLNPQKRLTTNHMNDQQILAQIHQSVSKSLKQHQQDKQQLLGGLPQEELDLSSEQEEEQNDWAVDEEDNNLQEEQNEEQEYPYGSIQQEQDEEGLGQGKDQDDQMFEGEEDVGLYGQQIDEQQMQSYQNQGDENEERQFEEEQKQIASKGKRKTYKQQQQDEDEGEGLIDDQFDHFREVEMQNKNNEPEPQTAEEKSQLQKQIQNLENKAINKKDWVLKGEVKGNQRPTNSLLQYDLQFKTGIRLNQEVTPEYNSELQNMIKQRILDQLYDDRVRYQHSHVLREQYSSLKEVSTEKSKMGLGQLYQAEFKNFLGLGDNKNDKLKQEIMQSFKEVNYYLDSLSNCNFTPRPSTGAKNEAVISEEKVPITMWKGSHQEPSKNINKKMLSEKEEDKHGKRLKNKRIARQRKKEQTKKKLNKKIEYGGMTKFQAKAMAQRAKNNLNKDNVKYNKSANFFAQMNKEKKGKPNPNLGKLKI